VAAGGLGEGPLNIVIGVHGIAGTLRLNRREQSGGIGDLEAIDSGTTGALDRAACLHILIIIATVHACSGQHAWGIDRDAADIDGVDGDLGSSQNINLTNELVFIFARIFLARNQCERKYSGEPDQVLVTGDALEKFVDLGQHVNHGGGIVVSKILAHHEYLGNVRLGVLRVEGRVEQGFVGGEALHEIQAIGTDEDGEAGTVGHALDELHDLAAGVELVLALDIREVVENDVERSVLRSRRNVDEVVGRHVRSVGR